jgi:predicted amidohydrolase
MPPAVAEATNTPGPYLRMYAACARALGVHVVGSACVRDSDGPHNSALLFSPEGTLLARYDKTYLTDSELSKGLVPGKGAVVADTPIGRIGFVICFDLNFAELRTAYAKLDPEIMCFPSMFHGGFLQTFWAYECRCHFVSAAQMAGCGIVDPFGRPLKTSDEYTSVPMAALNLDYAMIHLDYNREKFPEILRDYGPQVTIDIPPHVGSALLTSWSDDLTAMDVVEEYGLELLDAYLARAG